MSYYTPTPQAKADRAGAAETVDASKAKAPAANTVRPKIEPGTQEAVKKCNVLAMFEKNNRLPKMQTNMHQMFTNLCQKRGRKPRRTKLR